jgi:hypothetical protein
MMGNENQSLMMLNHYENYDKPGRVNYVVVFLVLAIQQSNGGSTTYTASPAGYGDEGKFVWMARISGTYEQMYINDGYMGTSNGLTKWKDETSFGNYSSTNGAWSWNSQGENCTINELMYDAASQYVGALTQAGFSVSTSWKATLPSYFTPVEIAGISTSPFQYGGLVPLVAIYQVNYPAYYAATGAKGTGVTNVG